MELKLIIEPPKSSGQLSDFTDAAIRSKYAKRNDSSHIQASKEKSVFITKLGENSESDSSDADSFASVKSLSSTKSKKLKTFMLRKAKKLSHAATTSLLPRIYLLFIYNYLI